MITIRVFGIIINPEAIVNVIVVFIITLALPFRITFNTEMIIGYFGQFTITAARFEQSLRKGDARRNTVKIHFLYGNSFKSINIGKGGIRNIGSDCILLLFLNSF